MKSIFINKESQLRSGWKIVLVFIAEILLLLLVSIAFNLILQGIIKTSGLNAETRKDLYSGGWIKLINILIQDGCFILIPLIFWKVLDKKPFRKMGLVSINDGYRDFIFGLIFGAVSITIVFTILLNYGSISLTNAFSSPSVSLVLITGLMTFILVGFGEEILCRGYFMTVLYQTKKKWAAAIVSSAIFSALHAGNPNTRPLAFINIFLVGLLFAYMYLKSSNIWMPIGYHITWNYFQGNIWGFEVSGGETQGLYQTEMLQENILNGGKFGPEGGLIVTIIILLGFIVVCRYYKKRSINDFLADKTQTMEKAGL